MQSITDYLRRSGDDGLGVGWVEENEHGFCVWRADEDSLILVNVYGNGTYWNKWADEKAKYLGVENIFFATKRNPQGFVRKYNYEVVGHLLQRKASWVR